MERMIRQAAVLGAGIMGARIAAHLANAGVPCLLLDVPGQDPDARDALARKGLRQALEAKPPAFFHPSGAALVEVGTFEDHLGRLREADWIIEAVVERLDVKQALLALVDAHRRPGSLVSSNTSGLPIRSLAEGRSEDFRRHFLGTHFFNPPRYMILLELIPTPETLEEVTAFLAAFGDRRLGKGIVRCKDTPNFIANRIGVFSMLQTMHLMVELGLGVEDVDFLTGPLLGRPKSATFRTADLVGLDTLAHVAQNLYDAVPEDESREVFRLEPFLEGMVAKGWLGDKTGQGFYRMAKGPGGEREILALDPALLDYRPGLKPRFPALEKARAIPELGPRLQALVAAKDRAGTFLWSLLSALLCYAARRVPEITEEIAALDHAMTWGFGWELGPFATWDALGVPAVAERLQTEGRTLPPLVEALLATGRTRFCERREGRLAFFDLASGTLRPDPSPEGILLLSSLKERNRLVKHNPGASLVDLGEGVLCLEFHSKMNTIGGDILQMTREALVETERNFEALVIGNQGAQFSAGANLLLLLLEAQEGEWDDLDAMVRTFQKATCSLRQCGKPVVAAPFGLALAGGCEFALGAHRVQAASELYMGLVEVGVGLVPAGGGTKEMLIRALEALPEGLDLDPFPFVRRAFETIGLAKVSTSAVDAQALGYLRRSDGCSMSRARLLEDAKQVALGLARSGHVPGRPRTAIPVMGDGGLANFKVALAQMREAGHLSEYDAHLGLRLARILCGGAGPRGFVHEQVLLDLERETFLSLLGEPRTQARIKHMLDRGKPLRN